MSTQIKDRINDIFRGSMLAGAITLGKRLGLFEALAQVSSEADPADAKRVAEAAGCKERYVREWLCAMAAGDLIEITPEERFWIKPNILHEFTGLNNFAVAKMSFVPSTMKCFNELTDAFRKDGRLGLEYAQFNDFYGAMDECTRAMHGKHLIPDYFPLIGMQEKLAAGGLQVLDVGCGSGFHARMMAQHFPKCHFVAIDISESAIAMAKDVQAKEAVTNLEYHVMDAGKMHADWSARFDFITIFDSCHDQMRPDLCIKEIHRLLKPGGLFAMLEIRGTSNAFTDHAQDKDHALSFYAISMFHCLPVASNCQGALCMGAMWGEKRARKLLCDCGFSEENIKTLLPDFFPVNIVYLCRK